VADRVFVGIPSIDSWLKPSGPLPNVNNAHLLHEAIDASDEIRQQFRLARGERVEDPSLARALLGTWYVSVLAQPVIWEGRSWSHGAGDTVDELTIESIDADPIPVLARMRRLQPESEPPETWSLKGFLEVQPGLTLMLHFEEETSPRVSRGLLVLCAALERQDLLTGLYAVHRNIARSSLAEPVNNGPSTDDKSRWINFVVPRPVVATRYQLP
jgi:hypothetical protein